MRAKSACLQPPVIWLTLANLLTEPWTVERLTGFFISVPVPAWFNLASPRVKSGEIDPQTIEPATA